LVTVSLCISAIFGDRTGTPCVTSLDCGTNLVYEVCARIDAAGELVKCTSPTDEGCECRDCFSDSSCDVNLRNDVCVDEHWCQMKSLVDSFEPRHIATVILIFVGAFIAAGGGLGGGGIFVPVYIILLQFDEKSAAGISQATIVGGSIVNLYMDFKKSHPVRHHRPLADFNTILVLEPALLGGTVIGVLLNEVLPDPIILVLLELVLCVALYRMVQRGRTEWKKENEAIKARSASKTNEFEDGTTPTAANPTVNVEAGDLKQSLLGDSNTIDLAESVALKSGTSLEVLASLSDDELMELDNLTDIEGNRWLPMALMAGVWTVVSFFSLLKSGLFFEAETCSTKYWLLEFAIFPCLFVITFFIARSNQRKFRRKLQLRWKPAEGDIEWDSKKSVIYPSIAALSGLLGGLLGIGGGMIVSPLLLELGVLPRVASATSAVAVATMDSSATFQKVVLGMIRADYGFFFAAVGMIATFFGQTVVNVAIKKYGRNSIVIAAVGAVIAAAIVLMGVHALLDMEWTFGLTYIC